MPPPWKGASWFECPQELSFSLARHKASLRPYWETRRKFSALGEVSALWDEDESHIMVIYRACCAHGALGLGCCPHHLPTLSTHCLWSWSDMGWDSPQPLQDFSFLALLWSCSTPHSSTI